MMMPLLLLLSVKGFDFKMPLFNLKNQVATINSASFFTFHVFISVKFKE